MKVKCLSLFSALLWFSQSLLHFLLFLLWGFFGFSYLSFGGWLRSSLKTSVLRKIILNGTVFLFLATVFNFFVTSSLLEKYLTRGSDLSGFSQQCNSTS